MAHIPLYLRLMHIPRRLGREAIRVYLLVSLWLVNRFGRSPIVQAGGPVVSLTTFGKRATKVFLAIESIGRGSVRPSRLMLWVDDQNLLLDLPLSIRRLQERGLEVMSCRDYGPHKKYYPFIESRERFDRPLVTSDDDIIYPRYWLETLVEANRKSPAYIHCYRARVVDVTTTGIWKYADLKLCNSTEPAFQHLATGTMGAIYPPEFLKVLKSAGASFRECCPKGDDLWLHVQALRSGFRVRQVFPNLPYFAFQGVPGTQETALSFENVTYGDGNDQQIRQTYTEADIRALQRECGAVRL